MSAFEDLMAMKTRAYLVKDIDPAILQRRLLGTRSLATELTAEQLDKFYLDKAPIPTNAKELMTLDVARWRPRSGIPQPAVQRETWPASRLDTIRGWVTAIIRPR